MSGITVHGRGEASGVPDVALISIGVSVRRASVADASAEAAGAAQAILARVQAAGVAESDLQTRHYSIAPEWDHRGDVPHLTGYRVDNMVLVRVRDIAAASDVIDSAAGAGGDALRINGVEFSLSDARQPAAAAREAAWHDAVAKATQLAKLAGVELGPPIQIEESTGHTSAPMMRAAAMERAGTPIAAGEHTTSVTLTVTFSIAG